VGQQWPELDKRVQDYAFAEAEALVKAALESGSS
jgi:hypothetical protein